MSITFTIQGKQHDLTQEQVVARLRGVQPEAARSLLVEIGGAEYPVKQALSVAIGADRADFISHQARSIFIRLGFTVRRV